MYTQSLHLLNTLSRSPLANSVMRGELLDMMLSGRIGVLFMEGEGEVEWDALAMFTSFAMANAMGTFISSRHLACTRPCFDMSGSMSPVPVGSCWTTRHPLAHERMTSISLFSSSMAIHQGPGAP
jgi:hypothetical protein